MKVPARGPGGLTQIRTWVPRTHIRSGYLKINLISSLHHSELFARAVLPFNACSAQYFGMNTDFPKEEIRPKVIPHRFGHESFKKII